jgi:hypothetical protein
MNINVGLLGLAIALAVGAALLLWWRTRVGGQIALMANTATSKAADVARMPAGSVVELKGVLRCAAPLTAEYSQQPSIHFKAEMIREEVYYDTDSSGKQRRNMRRTILHANLGQAPFTIEDETGAVAVNLEGAEVEAPETVNRVVNQHSAMLGKLLSNLSGGNNHDTFREIEFALSPDIPGYVLGEVQPDGTVGKPAPGSANKVFVVSHKSEEERSRELGSTMTIMLWSSVLLFAAAAGVLVWAIIRGPA